MQLHQTEHVHEFEGETIVETCGRIRTPDSWTYFLKIEVPDGACGRRSKTTVIVIDTDAPGADEEGDVPPVPHGSSGR